MCVQYICITFIYHYSSTATPTKRAYVVNSGTPVPAKKPRTSGPSGAASQQQQQAKRPSFQLRIAIQAPGTPTSSLPYPATPGASLPGVAATSPIAASSTPKNTPKLKLKSRFRLSKARGEMLHAETQVYEGDFGRASCWVCRQNKIKIKQEIKQENIEGNIHSYI